jgi:glycosyltransferase involved in cell wall biosynthesis
MSCFLVMNMKSLVIVIPAHNEESIIKQNVELLIKYLVKINLPVKWNVIVAENGSTDKTINELKKIKSKYFSWFTLPVRSRDKAIKDAWLKLDADYYMFLDADLATDIKHISRLVNEALRGWDIVAGSRRMKESVVDRTPFRKFMSFGFNLLMNMIFWTNIKDFQCGFKIISRKVRDEILPLTRHSDEGFMDTEIIVVGRSFGYKFKEIPVKWTNDRPSKFNMVNQITFNLMNAFKIKRDLLLGRYK